MGLFGNKSKENKGPDTARLLRYVNNLRPEDIDRLVDIAKGAVYAQNEEEQSQSMTRYFDLIQQVFGYSNTNFNTVGNSPQTRNQRYEIYEEMDESTAFISSALDILSDDATQPDEDNVVIHIESESEKINVLCREFIDEFELEEKISKWTRAVAKYGDLFIKLEGDYGEGIVYINDTIYPGMIDRRDLNGKLVAFADSMHNSAYSQNNIYAPWEFVHFRHKGDIYKEESSYARIGGLNNKQYDHSLTSAYGQSILRPAIKTYAQLRFTENMILLSRLTNSIRRNIFLINVGEVAPDKAFETIQNYASLLKKDINLNLEESMYTSAKHTVNYDEDIFIPVGDPQNDVRIETVGGNADIGEQYDLDYLLNKLFSALKVPKAYLNYEQDLNARSTLVQLDIRYARSVSQLQNTMEAGLKRLLNTHLAYKGLDPDEIDLNVYLTPVSAIDEEARAQQQQSQIANARDMWDLLTTIKDSLSESTELNLVEAAEEIMIDELGLSQELVDKIFNRKIEKSQIGKIYSSKSYRCADPHAAYPGQESVKEYERIRESILSVGNIDEESNE